MADSNNDDNRQDRPNRPGSNPGSSGNKGGPGGPTGPRGPQNFMSRGAMFWVVIAVVAVLLLMLVNSNANQAKEVSPQEFLIRAKNKEFKKDSVVVSDEYMVGTLNDDISGQPATKKGVENRIRAKLSHETKAFYVERLSWEGIYPKEDPGSSVLLPLLMYWGPFIVVCFIIYFFFFRSLRGAGGGPGGMLGSFGRSRHKVTNKEHSNVTLADVAGIDEAKEEVSEIVEFLKNPKKFQRLGGRVPRGVLLIGDPGCGKTLLAKAVAGEAEVPFFSISGSDFVEMFVGVGASRVRDLFKQAKDSSPCIIFLDEIDAVGRKRGSGAFSGGHDEREQTLNAILVEMDGFDTNDQVIVMAATNRSDVLDPALTRPGRFDRQIHVPLPDIRGRMEILKVHSRRIKMGPNVNLEKLARGTPMFSGADLAAIINEAAIGATLLGKDFVEQDDLEEARDKIKWGRARKSRKIEEEERVATAYHEAGHAVLQCLLPYTDPLHKVTIIPRGQAMGATISMPEKDRYGYGQRHLEATMRVLCGGRLAEQRKTHDISSGAAMDIRMATNMARHMILEWGMSDRLGFVRLGDATRTDFYPDKEYSDQTAKLIDEEVKRLTDEAYADAKRLIDENWPKVDALAQALLRYETLNPDDVNRIMRGEELTKPTVGDLLKNEQNKKPATPSPAPGNPGNPPPGLHDGDLPTPTPA